MDEEAMKSESPQESPPEAGRETDHGKKARTRVRVKLNSGERKSSGSGKSRRRSKRKGSSGITYSIAKDSPLGGGYRLWLTGFLIGLAVLVMAYLVLNRLAGPPAVTG